jgi:predicted AlkP superfamily phosphohydrolase/phosphomutase
MIGSRPHTGVAGLCLAAALLCVSCGDSDSQPGDARQEEGEEERQEERGGRVLLIGIDGATMRVIGPMIEQGRLPNLARLAAEGVSGPLRSFTPLQSPRIWATIATGKVPRKHRIRAFGYRDEDERIKLYLSSDREAHALWNITSDAGLSTSVINWWTTYPPEVIDGVMLTDHALPEELNSRLELFSVDEIEDKSPVVHPVSWGPRFLDILAKGEPLTEFANPFEPASAFPDFVVTDELSSIYRNDNVIGSFALEVEEALDPDVYLVYLKGIDRVCHHLWGMLEPGELYPESLQMSDAQRTFGAEAVRQYYAFSDAIIGMLLERFGPEDLVMVVSDHGFEAGVMRDHLTGAHTGDDALHGVIFARGPGVPAGRPAGPITINDITPTILSWLGLPVAEDMDGAPAAFLAREPVAKVATYETKSIERVGEVEQGSQEQVLDELRAIGYIE